MIYFVWPVLFLFAGLINQRGRMYPRFVFFAFCGLMILLAGLRWETGTDWTPYYEDYLEQGVRTDFEFGYQLLVRLFSSSGINYTGFLLFCSLISIGTIAFTCKKYLGFTIVALLVFYSFYYLGSFLGAGRRQFAIAICFFSILYITKNKFLPFIIAVLTAATFHISALIFLLAFPVYKLKDKNALIAVTALFFIIFGVVIFGFSNAVTFLFERLDIGIFSYKVITYATSTSDFGEPGLGMGFAKRLFILIFLFMARKYFDLSHPYRGLLNLYIFSFVSYVLFVTTIPMLSVLTIYYSITEVLLISYAVYKFKSIQGIVMVGFLAYIILQTYTILLPYWDLYVPYISILESQARGILY